VIIWMAGWSVSLPSKGGEALADIAPNIFSEILPRLGREPAKEEGFRDWVLSGVYQPLERVPGRSIELQRVSAAEFVPFVSYDFERFSLSSRESFLTADLEKANLNLTSWPLLKLYYSAFFAAHAVMRSLGCGVVKLESVHVTHLNAVLTAHNSSATPISSNMYIYKLLRTSSPAASYDSILLELAPRGAGVHDSFWKQFCVFLSEVADEAIKSRKPDASKFLAESNEVIDAIKGVNYGGRTWFSTVRNEVNYQHKYDTWYPMTRRSEALSALSSLKKMKSSAVRMDVIAAKKPLTAFVNVATFLACLNIEISELLAARSTQNRAFGQKWRRHVGHI